jgi:hypothetical protein
LLKIHSCKSLINHQRHADSRYFWAKSIMHRALRDLDATRDRKREKHHARDPRATRVSALVASLRLGYNAVMMRTRAPRIGITSLCVAALLAALACGSRSTARPADQPLLGTGPAYSIVAPSPEIDALAANFRGSCAFAKPPGSAIDYPARLRALARPPIDVRSTAEFDLADRTNRIGELIGGTMLAGAGPLALGGGGGVGYAVLVRDGDGRVCRGYVHQSSVEQVSQR